MFKKFLVLIFCKFKGSFDEFSSFLIHEITKWKLSFQPPVLNFLFQMSQKRKVEENSLTSQKILKKVSKPDQQDIEQEGSSSSKPEIENKLLSLEKFKIIKKLWFQVGENGKLVEFDKPAFDTSVSRLENAIENSCIRKNIKLPENFTLSVVKVAGEDEDLDDSNEGTKLDEIELRSSKNLKKAFAPLEDVDVIDQVLIRIKGKDFELAAYFRYEYL